MSSVVVFAQYKTPPNKIISGTIISRLSRRPVESVSVLISGTRKVTSTDAAGKFRLITNIQAPFTLRISSIGYKTLQYQVTDQSAPILIELVEDAIMGEEVVISASRIPEHILESPSSIERMGPEAIRETAAASFYDALANLKGVEQSTQSFTFKSINTRGFNANGNVRFNQFIDGMDNQAPGLNFSVGNIVGIPDLDLQSAELLPGTASAIFGAGGVNGTLLLNSKDPFKYQGLSVQLKTGLNHVDKRQTQTSNWNDVQLRYAKAWNNKLAFKVNFSYLQADDWQGQDYSDYDRLNMQYKSGDRISDPNYDGVNVYGDEIRANMKTVAQSVVLAGRNGYIQQYRSLSGNSPSETEIRGFLSSNAQTQPFFLGLENNLIPDQEVSRTGYSEKDLLDYNTSSLRTSAALHYRLSSKVEALAQASWGTGTSVYTGADRISLSEFSLGQYKLELRGQDFFLRGYTTQERAGDAYNATALASLMNEDAKASTVWFPQYVGNYMAALSTGSDVAQAHLTARNAADAGRFAPGSAEFNESKERIASKNIGLDGGARFADKTNLYHYEGMYNLSRFSGKTDLVTGLSYRLYDLNSDGTLFDDLNQELTIKEYGAYVQAARPVLADRVKLTVSVRYDKNENFKGRLTPRMAAALKVFKDNHLRVSWQSGFRNPTAQDQYIDLLVQKGSRIIGALPSVLDKYHLRDNQPYTSASYQAYLAGGRTDPSVLQTYTFGELGPERVQAWELGYRGLISSRLLLDAYYYFNSYRDFITGLIVWQDEAPDGPAPLSSITTFALNGNNPGKVSAKGWALGLDYKLGRLNLNGNVSSDQLSELPDEFFNNYNTPAYRFNIGIRSAEIMKNLSFNFKYRWQDEFLWRSKFVTGTVPAYGAVDMQVGLKLPAYRSVVRIGGSNLTNNYYRTSFGNPAVGAVYYVSLVFDQLVR